MEIFIGNIRDYSTEYLTSLVSKERISAAMRYRFEADRKRTLLAHALLNHAISGSYPHVPVPATPVTDKYGKPHIYTDDRSDNEIHFSLSHSGDYAVCAIDHFAIGADTEEIKDEKDGIADRFFAREERGYIKDSSSFYSIWSLKESFMKAVGRGMSLPMDSFTVCDFDTDTGNCRFKPCASVHGNDTDISFMEDLIDNESGYYKISGKTITEIPGYSLAYAVYVTHPGEMTKPRIIYPSL